MTTVRWIDERNARAARPCCPKCKISAVFTVLFDWDECDLSCECHDEGEEMKKKATKKATRKPFAAANDREGRRAVKRLVKKREAEAKPKAEPEPEPQPLKKNGNGDVDNLKHTIKKMWNCPAHRMDSPECECDNDDTRAAVES